MYHYIRVNPNPLDREGFNLSVTPSDFAAQMSYLSAHGYRTVTPQEIISGAARSGRGKPVAITFDDGYEDVYTAAYPILARHGFKATFYIISGFVGRPGYLTWDQIRALANAGENIGSHTVNHADLLLADPLTLRLELVDSKTAIQREIGRPVLDFAYPSGEYDPTVEQAVRAAGYRTAVTTAYGFAQPSDVPLALPRLRVFGGMTLEGFAMSVSGLG